MEAGNKSLKGLARHTSGGVAALHRQLPLRWQEQLFYNHSLPALRGKTTPVLPCSLEPPVFSQSVLSYGPSGAPTAALVQLWGATAPAALQVTPGTPAPALTEQAPHFRPVASLKFARYRFGWPIANTVLRAGDFVRSTPDRSSTAQLLRLLNIFYFADSAPGGDVAVLDPTMAALYFVAEEWKEAAGAAGSTFLNQQRSFTGNLVLGRTASLFGKALTWRGARADTVLFAPALERY